MGGGRFTATDWDSFTATRTAGKSTAHVFTSHHGMDPAFDPSKIVLRESRDSVDNPNSTPILCLLDCSGSMGFLADEIARNGLKVLFEEIYKRKPVSDPACLVGVVGDSTCDRAPLQVSQFESDIRIADQVTKLFLEGGGGGNSCESYTLAWYFAAMKTSTDAFEKNNRKGYVFTVGDEEPNQWLRSDEIKRVFGVSQANDMTAEELLEMVERKYHVFHIIVEEGSHCSYPARKDAVIAKWRNLLGQRAILLSDHKKLAEVVVSAISVVEGESADKVAKSWSGDTSLVVTRAIKDIVPTKKHTGSVVRL